MDGSLNSSAKSGTYCCNLISFPYAEKENVQKKSKRGMAPRSSSSLGQTSPRNVVEPPGAQLTRSGLIESAHGLLEPKPFEILLK